MRSKYEIEPEQYLLENGQKIDIVNSLHISWVDLQINEKLKNERIESEEIKNLLKQASETDDEEELSFLFQSIEVKEELEILKRIDNFLQPSLESFCYYRFSIGRVYPGEWLEEYLVENKVGRRMFGSRRGLCWGDYSEVIIKCSKIGAYKGTIEYMSTKLFKGDWGEYFLCTYPESAADVCYIKKIGESDIDIKKIS